MYQAFFGLTELPFELTANLKYLFLTPSQREALSTLQYGLFSAKALTLLVGEAGTGKTTLIQAALQSERCRQVRCVYLDNPVLPPEDFLRTLALKFDLGTEASISKSLLLDRLRVALCERRARGEITALVVDEAQSLSTALLEELRLLANIETPTQKLLPLILAGQPELGDRLEEPELRQLKQRVTLRCELVPFDMLETASYIACRIVTAGGAPATMFTRDAVALIHENSGGIARSINVICDNALLDAMALGRRLVDRASVVEVCRDLRLQGVGAPIGQTATARPAPREEVAAPEAPAAPAPAEPEQSPVAGTGGAAASRRFGRFPLRWGSPAPAVPATSRTLVE